MYAHRTRQLSDTADRQFHFLTRCHNQVTELVNDDHDIRHEAMALFRIQLSVNEFRIIFFDITATGFAQQVVSGIHFYTQ